MKNLNMFALLAIALLALAGFTGCDDDEGFELVPCTNCGTGGAGGSTGSGGSGGNLNPGPGGAGGDQSPENPSCRAVPGYWDLKSFNGCMTSSDLSVALRDANHREVWMDGKPFVQDATKKIGELVYLVADGTECGPVTVSAVSNSGTVELMAGADVDWYLIDTAYAELIWTKLHGGNPPTYADLMCGEFASLLIDIFECEEVNPSCALKSTIPNGWPNVAGLVKYQLTGPNATTNGAFCGLTYVVARSK